ncbi:hypothetical protein [Nocardia nepalensis]
MTAPREVLVAGRAPVGAVAPGVLPVCSGYDTMNALVGTEVKPGVSE